jgi:hypothetical protein
MREVDAIGYCCQPTQSQNHNQPRLNLFFCQEGNRTFGEMRILHDESNADHLLRESNDKSSDFRIRALGVVHRYCHRQQTYSPPSENSTDQNHGKILSRTLKNSSNKTNEGSHENCQFSPEAIHGEAALKGPKDCATIEGRIDGSDNIGIGRRVEKGQKVLGGDNISHNTCIVSEQE